MKCFEKKIKTMSIYVYETYRFIWIQRKDANEPDLNDQTSQIIKYIRKNQHHEHAGNLPKFNLAAAHRWCTRSSWANTPYL